MGNQSPILIQDDNNHGGIFKAAMNRVVNPSSALHLSMQMSISPGPIQEEDMNLQLRVGGARKELAPFNSKYQGGGIDSSLI
jgi:hypothetical protein